MSKPHLPKQPEYIKLDANSEVQQRLPAWPADQDEITEAVVRAIATGHWSRYSNGMNALDGSPHQLVCQRLRTLCGSRHVRLVSSGTAAVELALRACRVSTDDEVILSAYDYPGNLRCISALGARAVMVDVESNRWTMDVQQVRGAITKQTRAILVSHLYQNMAAVKQLRDLADEADVYLIEDACQSPGAKICSTNQVSENAQDSTTQDETAQITYTDQIKYAGTVGHIGTLSFGGTKLLSTGNGGAILTDDDRLSQRLTVALERPSDTFPLSQLQAAALLPQLETLQYWNARRQQGAKWFTEQLSKLSNSLSHRSTVFVPEQQACDLPAALYKFAFFVQTEELRDYLLARVRPLGIPCGHGFPCFVRRSSPSGRGLDSFPNAARAAATSVVMDHRVLIAEADLREEILDVIATCVKAS